MKTQHFMAFCFDDHEYGGPTYVEYSDIYDVDSKSPTR
jgi:hypothetical protein